MSNFDDLVVLDLQMLSETLAAGVPNVSELEASEWLGIVEVIAARLTDESRGLSTGSWGVCSDALDHALNAAVESGAISQTESVIRRLNLSLVLLQSVPTNATISILNPHYQMDLLFQELSMSTEEARTLSIDWRRLEIEKIRRLRTLKNLLSPALALARHVYGDDLDERLKVWESVFPSLP
jgi:hypothetical protein